jgi:hypothetical protein
VAKMARATTAYGTPHPAWGQETCRVCARGASPAAPTDDSIEELPGPRTRSQTTSKPFADSSRRPSVPRASFHSPTDSLKQKRPRHTE